MGKSIEGMTLQEKVKNTELLIRELIQHLEMGFVPKLKQLQKVSRVGKSQSQLEDIADLTVRNHVSQVIETEQFTDELYQRLKEYTEALEKDMQTVIYGE